MSSETEKSEVMPKATRYVSPLDEFEKLHVLVWFEYLLNRTGTYVADEKGKISTKKFGAWIQANEINSAPLPLQSSRWSEYINGKRCPSELMLSNMDIIIPGSSIVYLNGDETLPLWSVLRAATRYWDLKELAEEKELAKTNPPSPQGEVQALSKVEEKKLDTKIINEKLIAKKKKAEKDRLKAADYFVCEKLVNEVLGEFGMYEPNMTVRSKCEAILRIVTNHERRNWLYGHLVKTKNLEEFLGLPTNRVSEQFNKTIHDPKNTNDAGRPYNILNRRVVLSVIAVSHICLYEEDTFNEAIGGYLIAGINAGAVEYHFGKDVSDFYKNPVIIEPPLVG